MAVAIFSLPSIDSLAGVATLHCHKAQLKMLQRLFFSIGLVVSVFPPLSPLTVASSLSLPFFIPSFVFLIKIARIRTASYHPAANGIVEYFYRRLKDALHATASVMV